MPIEYRLVRAEVDGREEAEKDSLDTISPLEKVGTQSSGEHSPTVDATCNGSGLLTSTGSIATLNGSSSPISTLLEELLLIIFEDVITSESSSCQCRRKRAGWWLSSPRNIASVSKIWRTVVFGCPLLWRHVHLTPTQPVQALQEQLRLSAPLPIHLVVHQWPFRNPISSGPFSIVTLTAQLQSILSVTENEDVTLAPASQRVESIAINATESSTFLNFVFQTWTGRGSKFPNLRQVEMNGNLCATWSRSCFFDGRNAPKLDCLELSNVVIAQDAYRLPWGIGQNLTTLVWAAPPHKHGSLVVSVACFHHVVSSLPNLTTLELRGHVVALEFMSLETLQAGGITPLKHIRRLRVSGHVFPNASAAFILFYLLPSLTHLSVRGRASSGSYGSPTVTLALQALVCLPKVFGWPMVLPNLENLDFEYVGEDECEEWKTWCMEELEVWREWREIMANARSDNHIGRVRAGMVIEEPTGTDEHDLDVY